MTACSSSIFIPFSARWSGNDPESGIAKFEYSVGTTVGGTEVKSWTNAGTSLEIVASGLSLVNGKTYYVNVRATNGAGLVGPVGSSDGAVLDTTAPAAPVVTDDGAWTASTTDLHASWSAADPESGIKSYKYALGTIAGGPTWSAGPTPGQIRQSRLLD